MGIPRLSSIKSASCGWNRVVVVAAVLLGLIAAGIVEVQSAAGIDFSIGLCDTLVRPWGYPCNEYTVQTDDGFLLVVQNIPNGISQQPSGAPRVPVFLQHGLFGGGDNWVFNDPKESLGFILADAGYDVWIGNIRGINWSHGHVNLTTKDAVGVRLPAKTRVGVNRGGCHIAVTDGSPNCFPDEFWNWSWDELAAYDLPAMLGFVHKQKGSKVMYIGHSQATSMLMAGLVGTAQSQALTNMLKGVVLICPIAYMNKISSSFDKIASELYMDKILDIFGTHEFHLYNQLGVKLVQEVCGTTGVNCTSLYRAVTGKSVAPRLDSGLDKQSLPDLDDYLQFCNDCCMNDTRLTFYLKFFPQATSSKNLGHFAQMIRKNSFSKYDYSLIGNLKHYGQLTPPAYNLANYPSSLPLMIVRGGQDSLADPRNVQDLVTLLGAKVTKLLSVERYAHGDFLVSTTANVDVYPEIISFLRNPNTR